MTNLGFDIFDLLLGAAIGAVFSYFLPIGFKWIKKRRKKKIIENRIRVTKNGVLWKWLVEFYKEYGEYRQLYDCKFNSYEAKIPFLTLPSWQKIVALSLRNSGIVEFAKSEKRNFPIVSELINQRIGLGQLFFENEPAIYTDRIEDRGAEIVIHTKACGFEEIATRMIALENEAFKGAIKGNIHYATLRRTKFTSCQSVFDDFDSPKPLGCAVAFFVKNADGAYEVLIHERSEKTITWGGAKAVLPNYGLMPIPDYSDSADVDLLFNNFIREYLEELFNYEELIRIASLKKTDIKWFYEMPEAKQLLECLDFNLYFTGMGLNCLNGVLNISLLALIDDELLGEKIKKEITGNWEIKVPGGSTPSIEFITLGSVKLEGFLKSKTLNPASAYAIARGIEMLKQRKVIIA